MSTWNKRTKGQRFSRQITFRMQNSQEKELFLKLAMQVLDNQDVRVDTRLERIQLEIYGERDQVEAQIDKLKKIERQIYRALRPDKEDYYEFDPYLLGRLFHPPYGMQLWENIINIYNFEATLTPNNTLRTTATLNDIQEIHKQTKDLVESVPAEEHKDIKRFLITVALESGNTNFQYLIQRSIETGFLDEDENNELYFTTDHNTVVEEFLKEISSEGLPVNDVEKDVDPMTLEDMFFQGGEVVFTKDGKRIDETEIDQSSYDRE